MKKILLLIFMAAALKGFAQTVADTTLEVVPIRETVISANRSSQARSAVAQQVKILTKNEIFQNDRKNTFSGSVF